MIKNLFLVSALIIAVFLFRTTGSKVIPPSTQTSSTPVQKESEGADIKIIMQNLDTPWAIAFLPDKSMLVTERGGTIRLITPNVNFKDSYLTTIKNVEEIGEGGLLGITLHPDFVSNKYIYIYYTYSNTNGNTLNRVVRMKYENKVFSPEDIIVDAIPGASNHNGGRIKFGPDKFLYITTGDAQEPSQAQDTDSLVGKILRVTDSGKPAPGNPFNNRTYSYGHRNPQGLTWNGDQLWATEHGRSGSDELNRIESGKNYGWPEIEGDKVEDGKERAFLNSGSTTWAPAGAVFLDGSIYFGGLRGTSLYKASVTDNKNFKEFLHGKYGRIREVEVGPDKMIYITTSNQDGRGVADSSDDKIIRINPKMLK